MASNNEGSIPLPDAGKSSEKDQINSVGRSRNSLNSRRSTKKSTTKQSANTSPNVTDQCPPDQQGGDKSQRPKPRSRSASLMRKMSMRRKDKKSEGNSKSKNDCDTICLEPSSSKSVSNKVSVPKEISKSVESISLTYKDDEGLTMKPTIRLTPKCSRENQSSSSNVKGEKIPETTQSSSTPKKIALTAAGKSFDFEYIGDSPDIRSNGSVAAMFKASMSPKAARKFFGKNSLFKKESPLVSKIEKENQKHVSKFLWKNKTKPNESEERKNDIDKTMAPSSIALEVNEQDLHKSNFDLSTLAPNDTSVKSSSSLNDTVDGFKQLGKTKDSGECTDNKEEVRSTFINNDVIEIDITDTADPDTHLQETHTHDEINLQANRNGFQQALTSENHGNSSEKLETQDIINSVSSETDVHKKLIREENFSQDEKVTTNLDFAAHEISDTEMEQTDVSKSLASENIHFEMTEKNIESTAVNSSSKNNCDEPSSRTNNHPPHRFKLERDNSRLHFGTVSEKKTPHNSGEENLSKGESKNTISTSSGLEPEDPHSDEKSSSMTGFFKHGLRSTRKPRKGNFRTLERRIEFPVKYMRVHGESEGAYRNESEPRGLIFMKNIESFSSSAYNPRNGSSEDYTNLLNLFLQMGYIPAENLCQSGFIKKDKLIKDLKTFAKMNHKNYDSTIIIIMSHGVEDKTFVTSDEKEVELSKLYSILNNNNCRGLTGKPKIFIFQFCRPTMQRQCAVQLVNSIGEGLNITISKPENKTDIRKMLLNFFTIAKLQDGSDQSLNRGVTSQLDVRVADDSETEMDDDDVTTEANYPGLDMDSMKPVLPSGPDLAPENSDMYSIFATQAGGVAYRDPKKGSLLIQAICDVFSKHAYHDDIDALVRKVSQHVQNKITDIQSQDATPTRPGAVERVNSGLDKLFYFNPFPRGVMVNGMLSDMKLLTPPKSALESHFK